MKLWVQDAHPPEHQSGATNELGKPSIVFIHGLGSNSQMWRHQVPFFIGLGHSCFLLDLRGHGKSPEPRERTNLAVHIDDVIETLDSEAINFPAYFVGHSLGAIISVSLAAKQPKLFKSIFAASMPGKVLFPTTLSFQLFLSGPMQKLNQSKLKQYLPWRERTLLEMDPYTLSEILDNFAAIDFVTSTSKVACPVHFAAARFDPIAPYWYSVRAQKNFSNSTFKTFEWSGHNFMDSRTEEFNQWILSKMKTEF